MFLFSYLTGIFAIFCFVLAAFILYEKRKNILGVYMGLLILSSGLWALANSAADFSTTRSAGVFWSGIAVSSFLMLAVFFLCFVAYFIHKRPSKMRLALYYFPGLFLSCFAFSKFSTVDIIVLYDRPAQTIVGPLYTVGGIFVYVAFFIAYYQLLRSYRKFSGIQRAQTGYIILGSVCMLVGLTLFDIILPIYGELRFFSIGPMTTLFMVASISYAILKHQLMNIEVILRRGTVFTALFGVVAIFLGYSVTFLSNYLPLQIARLVAAFVVTASFLPLKAFLERMTDALFFRKHYKFENAVQELNHILIRTPSLEPLLSNLINHLKQILKVERAVVVLAQPQKEFISRFALGNEGKDVALTRASPLIQYFSGNITQKGSHGVELLDRESLERQRDAADSAQVNTIDALVQEMKRLDAALVAPFISNGNLIGVLLLGAKRSRDAFSAKDIQFLDVVSHETAVSIENALNVERLMKLDEAKSEFIAVVSHQLRTPLAGARWNLEVLLENVKDTLAADQQSGLVSAHQAVMVMNDGLNNLITALEIEEGKLSSAQDNTELSKDIIDPVLKDLRSQLMSSGIAVRQLLEVEGTIRTDVKKVRRVLGVLLDNAIKYSPRSSVITLRLKKETYPDHSELIFSVEDQGIGVAPVNRATLFQKFFRGSEAKIKSPGGFGLGLFIAQAYAQLQGGKVWLGEKQTPGSVFYFSLPLAQPRNSPAPSEPPRPQSIAL